ncbi:hypothetical protein L2E82_20632 [Cichorium intybus]|uniref:Uncharacterized protein n=1 Tax=Cichorium intybus TaxID=13427 RepID=A0ACB9DTK0_CICIN|nr:hypothetical protein L2E82_20632 [Cichorium intybus]
MLFFPCSIFFLTFLLAYEYCVGEIDPKFFKLDFTKCNSQDFIIKILNQQIVKRNEIIARQNHNNHILYTFALVKLDQDNPNLQSRYS